MTTTKYPFKLDLYAIEKPVVHHITFFQSNSSTLYNLRQMPNNSFISVALPYNILGTLQLYLLTANSQDLIDFDIYDYSRRSYYMNSEDIIHRERTFMPKVYTNKRFSIYVHQQTKESDVFAYFRIKEGMSCFITINTLNFSTK